MTISASTAQTGPVAANGVAPIPFSFQSLSAAEVGVERNGAEVFTGFTVTRNEDGSGTVIPSSSWGTDQVLIFSKPTFGQPAAFPNFQPVSPPQIEKALDRQAAGLLALKGQIDRGIEYMPGPAGDGVSTLSAMRGLNPASGDSCIVAVSGLEGLFYYRVGNYSAQVTADPLMGIYIPTYADAAGLSGCWVRAYNMVDVRWFGAPAAGADFAPAINAAIAVGSNNVWLPEGDVNIYSPILMNRAGITLRGVGRLATRLVQHTLSLDCITVTGDHCRVEKLSTYYTGGTPTGGCGVRVTANNFSSDEVLVRNGYNGMQLQGSTHHVGNLTALDCENTSINILGPSYDIFVSKAYLNCGNKTRANLGNIRIANKCEAINFTDCEVLQGKLSLAIDSTLNTNGNRPAYITFTNVYFDSSDYGTSINNTAVLGFIGCWFSNGSKAYPGSLLTTDQPSFSLNGNADTVTFTDCKFFSGGSNGAFINSTVKRAVFEGCKFGGNSVGTANAFAGLLFAAGTTDFSVKGCVASNGLGAGSQSYGIQVAPGASDRYIIADNLVSGNVTGGVSDGGTGTNKRVANNY